MKEKACTGYSVQPQYLMSGQEVNMFTAEVRDHVRQRVIELACLRLGENAFYGRGFDRLPSRVGDPLADALVCSLKEAELRRALAVATRCLIGELEEWDATLCARLSPVLQEFGAPPAL